MSKTCTARERLTDAALEMIWENSYGATSVDAICERAQVRKGSFYYYFKSKSELAAAALHADWEKTRPALDSIFSPINEPLERLRQYCDFGYRKLQQIKEQCGHVLGCPVFTLGSEVCTQDDALLRKIQEILSQKLAYLESAVRDAHTRGDIQAPDAHAKAEALFALFQGTLMQARIQDDVEVLRNSYSAALDLLGVHQAVN